MTPAAIARLAALAPPPPDPARRVPSVGEYVYSDYLPRYGQQRRRVLAVERRAGCQSGWVMRLDGIAAWLDIGWITGYSSATTAAQP